MAYSIQLSDKAELDIDSAVTFISLDSPLAAARWHTELWSLIFSLSEMPTRFAVIPEAAELKLPYRAAVHYSHRIVYRVAETENIVYVVRIYHGARKPLQELDME